jgi:hypothetical protein
VYHEGAARFHVEGNCFARLAQGVHYLALEKLDAGTMLQARPCIEYIECCRRVHVLNILNAAGASVY